MRIKEIRDLTAGDLAAKIAEKREELANLKFQHSLKQLNNSAQVRLVRRELAKMLTIQKEETGGIRIAREARAEARRSS
ncbi:MAG: 50S ribosomal protein L29 [Calditrichaeota bacterium]|nr:50S ribosomal protein L29 [Calditrichota bacterium]